MPELSAENEKTLECFRLCESQVRATSGGSYALDWRIVKDVAESMGMPVNGHFYRLLKAYEQVFMEETHSK